MVESDLTPAAPFRRAGGQPLLPTDDRVAGGLVRDSIEEAARRHPRVSVPDRGNALRLPLSICRGDLWNACANVNVLGAELRQ